MTAPAKRCKARWLAGALPILWSLLPAATLGATSQPLTPADDTETREAAPAADPYVFTNKGVRVRFAIAPAETAASGETAIREGEYADVSLEITDAETGAPISPLEPALWISRPDAAGDMPCKDRIGRYLQGTLAFQADIDLNKYFILILNDDSSISVVDPLVGVSGITQLYAMIMLEGRGEDWTRSTDDKIMFVTMPEAGKVAVVDLTSFKVTGSVTAGSRPVRIVLQPDGKYLWIGNDATEPQASGVTVIDARKLTVAGFVPTGAGHHEVAFTDDSLTAFVSNAGDGTVAVVDIQSLETRKTIAVGPHPVGVEYSSLGRAAYVASRDTGMLTVIDGDSFEIKRTVPLEAGISTFRFAPGGRWAFAANPQRNRVVVLDASADSVVHVLDITERPSEFAFTDTYAYVRRLDSADVTLVPLAQLGGEAAPGLQRVPLGSRTPGEYSRPAAAPSISPTGEWTSIVATNPVDKMVYYYMEGMIAPMGSYTTYGRTPRAVGIVDRSVRELEKGVYGARVRIPHAGAYNAAFIVDSPTLYHCFTFEAEPNPGLHGGRSGRDVSVSFLAESRETTVGKAFPIQFVVTDTAAQEQVPGLHDIQVIATRPPGQWQERLLARDLGGGRYEVQVVPEEAGAYYVTLSIPSLAKDATELPYLSFRATAATSADERR